MALSRFERCEIIVNEQRPAFGGGYYEVYAVIDGPDGRDVSHYQRFWIKQLGNRGQQDIARYIDGLADQFLQKGWAPLRSSRRGLISLPRFGRVVG